MTEAELTAVTKGGVGVGAAGAGERGIGRGGLTLGALLAWLAVGVPIAWGIWTTLTKALILFG